MPAAGRPFGYARRRRETDTVSLVVGDDGPGIPQDERSHVMDRFYRLDRSRSLPGNGLGLSIVAAIASFTEDNSISGMPHRSDRAHRAAALRFG
jgi:signal transduction histidine kinase